MKLKAPYPVYFEGLIHLDFLFMGVILYPCKLMIKPKKKKKKPTQIRVGFKIVIMKSPVPLFQRYGAAVERRLAFRLLIRSVAKQNIDLFYDCLGVKPDKAQYRNHDVVLIDLLSFG